MQDGAAPATQPAPIVHNGVLYVNNAGKVLQALDAKTGDLIWENRYGTNPDRARHARHRDLRRQDLRRHQRCAPDGLRRPQRQDRLGHHHRRPLQGQLLHHQRPPRRQRQTHPGPRRLPAPIGDEKCFISAYDAKTGKEVWRFNTIALNGEPGGDTWGGLPDTFRAGAETWITGSYDPDLNLTYWGTAQAKPWMRVSRGSGNGATLYANSTLALNADTGKLAGFTITPRARRWISTKSSNACWWMIKARSSSSAPASPASCGSSTARPENIWATRKWCSRMSTIPSTRPPASRTTATISSSSARRMGLQLPVHRRRQELAGDVATISPAIA